MNLKVFNIAKELGIDSKAIIAKCKAEGIPKIDTHMSPVGAGLAETIREWFSSSTELRNAVEQTEHVDVLKAKATARKRHSKAKGAGHSSDSPHDSETATITAEPDTIEELVEEPAIAHVPHHPAPVEPVAPVEPETIVAPEVIVAPPVAPEVILAPVVPETPAVEKPKPVAPVELRPAAAAHVAAPPAPPAPAGSAPPVHAKHAAPHQVPQKPVRPAILPRGIPNVPTRPTTITPAGQLVQPTKAVMAGPKVVRVEQPDNIPAPRPRQMRPPGGQGGPGQGFAPRPQQDGGPNRGGGTGGGMNTQQNFPPAVPLAGQPTRHGHGSGGRKGVTTAADDDELKKKLRTNRRSGGRHADAGIDLIREWREADLVDRAERIAGAAGVLRERKREMNKQRHKGQHAGPVEKPDHVTIEPPVIIRALAEALGIKGADIVRKLMAQGVIATVNQVIDNEAALAIAIELGVDLEIKAREPGLVLLGREFKDREDAADKVQRSAVVTILGHVDHGKTSLLDKIRSANVAAGEAGGITQHIGAYTVSVPGSDGKEKRVTFLDTPGHQAFTAMRARGANMTDVVVLVVAADDGVMPQTIESIDHAKASGVPIVVAMNKIDKPEADPNKVLGQLAQHGLNPAEWGGDVEVVRTSAVTGQGVKELIEYLDYVAQLRELKGSPQLPARGAVIEAFMDQSRGVIARVLVQNGTLRVGDIVVCGTGSGRVRSLVDDKGKQITEATPSTPVELVGLDNVPSAGEKFYALGDLNRAKELAEERVQTDRAGEIYKRSKVTLDNLFDTIKLGDVKELTMILKADVQGSVDVLKGMMTEELSKEVKVNLIRAAVGGITESDILLAETTGAIVVGFSVVPDETARKLAEDLGVEVRLYRVIYEITDDIRKALAGMLSPEKQEQILGHAEVRQVIKISRVGNVAGCIVTDGVLQRNNKYRLIREGTVVTENLLLDSLKRFKEDVKEVRGGIECGIKVAGYDDLKIGDRFEAYKTVDVARTL